MTTPDPLRASDPVPPAAATESAVPPPPKQFSVGGSPQPWRAAPSLDYSRAYAPPAQAYAQPSAYGAAPPSQGYAPPQPGYAPQQPGYAPQGYGAPPGYPPQGFGGDPRAAAYFDRMHAARAPHGEDDDDGREEEGEDDDEVSESDDEEASRASTKDSKKRAARAALASKEKAQRLAREKHVLTQLMLAAPESALDTLFQAPNVQAAVQEFVNGRLDIEKLERDLIVIQCIGTVRGQHAANRSLDEQAPRIAGGVWNLVGMGAELGGVVPAGSWDLSSSEWSAEEENARKVQRDWVRTAMSMMGAGGGASPTAMLIQQLLTLAAPIVAIGAKARSMAPPPQQVSPPSPQSQVTAAPYTYSPQPPPPQTFVPPPQSFAPAPVQVPPPSTTMSSGLAAPAASDPMRSTQQTMSVLDAPTETAAVPRRPPTPDPPPITVSYTAAPVRSSRIGDALFDDGLDL